MAEEFTFFWNGPFSQWADSEFEFHGMTFDRAEQFMMFCKAVVFEDFAIAKKIMETLGDPGHQKALGRKVKNFDADVWNKVARDVVYVGSFCKYSQNLHLIKSLEFTRGTTLVEASPYDKIWGIGLDENNPLAFKRATWEGKNWLGEVLTKLREDFDTGQKNDSAFKLCEQLVDKYLENTKE